MRCALTIKGKVQNAGYRGFIEDKARDRHLGGYVFNSPDGSVQLVCEGAGDKIDDFLDVITLHEKDIFVENILKHDVIDPAFPIPGIFGRVKTDTKEDTYRKLDKGVNAIKDVGLKVKDVGEKVKDVGEKVKDVGEKVKGVGEKVNSVKEDTVLLHGIKKDTGVLQDMKDILVKHTEILERIAEK